MTKLCAVALALALVACGSKDKKDPTTPGGGGGGGGGSDPSSMNDDGSTPGGGGGGAAPGGGGGGGGGGVSNDGGGAGPANAPMVTPPNLDPDPAEAKAAVDMHLRVARQALGQPTPDPETALREAKLALGIDAASVDAAVVIAHAYYMKKLYDTAEVLLDELFKRPSAKNNPGLYYVYGLVYDKLGKKQEAVLAYTKAVELDDGYASARINLGVHQLANKNYRDAMTNFERVVALGRDDAEIRNALGSAYRGHSMDYPPGAGDRDQLLLKAESAYKRATEADRNHGPAFYNLGLLYLDADPFPTSSGPLDTLERLNRAKTYFDEYKNRPGVDLALHEERLKDVTKLIKREQNRRKKAAREAAGGG